MPKKMSYADVQSEIARLQAQAAALLEEEKALVVAEMRERIAAYGISAQDLGLTRKSAAHAPSAGSPKYRDPVSGKTWTGRGKPPNWIAAAEDRSAFLVDQAPPQASGARKNKSGTRKRQPQTA